MNPAISPHFNHIIKPAQEYAWEQQSMMPYDEQLRSFLEYCNRRGSRHDPKRHPLPNLSRLAKYCDCDCSTLLRIATGETERPSVHILKIVNAIACISPAAFDGDIRTEQKARTADAEQWLLRPARDELNIWAAISKGIKKRIELAKQEQAYGAR